MPRAGHRMLRSARNGRRYARGETTEGFVVHVPDQVDVRAIRRKLGLSQPDFAARFGFSLSAVREWEHGRRRPEQAARMLLLVIEHNPDAVREALAGGSAAA
ncbi:MAG: type II toxin-antitoxin system MqsA family antitoxin [Acidisphaera sp.]|nr:type II toxin-antitoxin system MqsA family antitoxin [Acidisphaera sp.]